ncbi:MAG: gamma-glutamylcyclotransferase family protein [Polyangiales bacterium]
MFVYGTLLRGEHNHRLLRGARLVAVARTVPRYTLVSLGGFPGMIDGGRTSVVGEVYRLADPSMLAVLDRLEGHPRFYERRAVSLARGPRNVEGYVLPADQTRGRPVIVSGDWRAHRAAQRPRDPFEEGMDDLACGRISRPAMMALIALRRGRP